MRIAVCISGHIRDGLTNQSMVDFLSFMRERYEVGVFVATWDRENTNNSWSQSHGLSNLERSKNKVCLQQVSDFYQSSQVIIINYDFFASDRSPLRLDVLTTRSNNFNREGAFNDVLHSSKMYFLMHQANILKLTSKAKYDLVFRVRPDFTFSNTYKSFNFELLPNCVFCANARPTSFEDQFFWGDERSMDILSSTFLSMPLYFEKDIFGDPERFLSEQVKRFGIKKIDTPRFGHLISETQNHAR